MYHLKLIWRSNCHRSRVRRHHR